MEPTLIPQTLDELTPEWLTGILHDRGVLRGARVIRYESEFLSDVGSCLSPGSGDPAYPPEGLTRHPG